MFEEEKRFSYLRASYDIYRGWNRLLCIVVNHGVGCIVIELKYVIDSYIHKTIAFYCFGLLHKHTD